MTIENTVDAPHDVSSPTSKTPLTVAREDLAASFERLSISLELAIEDLRDRFRRSYIGLAWIALSFAGFVGVKALVFADFYSGQAYDFFSHLAIGFALFTFVSTVVTSAAHLFVLNRNWILSSNLPYTIYANTLILRSLVELALVGLAAGLLIAWFGKVNPGGLWSILPALVAYFLTSLGLCMVLGPIGARFRDVIFALQTVMRMMFFATPIIWVSEPNTVRGDIALWNPLTHYIEIIRRPLIAGEVPFDSWLIVIAITVVLCTAGLFVFGAWKRYVPIWV